jgi:hypothetical protein
VAVAVVAALNAAATALGGGAAPEAAFKAAFAFAAAVDTVLAVAPLAPLAAAGANKATRTKPTAVRETAMHAAMASSRNSQARSFLRVTAPVARPRMMRTADWLPALPPDENIIKVQHDSLEEDKTSSASLHLRLRISPALAAFAHTRQIDR